MRGHLHLRAVTVEIGLLCQAREDGEARFEPHLNPQNLSRHRVGGDSILALKISYTKCPAFQCLSAQAPKLIVTLSMVHVPLSQLSLEPEML